MRGFMHGARRRYFELGELSPSANREAHFMRPHYEGMFDFLRDCQHTGGCFDRNWENIEELYTQADLVRSLGCCASEQEKASRRCRDIAWSIWDVYRPSDERPHTGDVAYLRAAVGRCQPAGLTPVIITTNYDLAPELAMPGQTYYPAIARHEFGSVLHAGLYEDHVDSELPHFLHDRERTAVIKLHGSANWFSVRGRVEGRPNESEHTVALAPTSLFGHQDGAALSYELGRPSFSPSTAWDVLHQIRGPHAPKKDTCQISPTIIPPTLGKHADANIVKDQWAAAVEALAGARQVWTIGYSFPTTDTFMPRMLIEGLRKNRDLEFFGIVDPAGGVAWRDRLSQLFAPSFREQKLRFFPMNARDFYHQLASDVRDGVSTLLRSPFSTHAELRASNPDSSADFL